MCYYGKCLFLSFTIVDDSVVVRMSHGAHGSNPDRIFFAFFYGVVGGRRIAYVGYYVGLEQREKLKFWTTCVADGRRILYVHMYEGLKLENSGLDPVY
jgi:hypothetical protein